MSHDPAAPPPPAPASTPRLTPQFCLNTTALRDFLRLSRSTIDDSLSLHLNALLTPSRKPFLSTSTSTRSSSSFSLRQQIPAPTCRTFKDQILFPSWKSRDDIFTYCASVAETPEAIPSNTNAEPAPFGSSTSGAPPAQRDDSSPTTPSSSSSPSTQNRYSIWGRPLTTPPNERLDPYSARDYSYNRYTQAEVLKDVLVSEQGVERIVRGRTWGVLGERCLDEDGGGVGVGEAADAGWEGALGRWREGRGR